MPIAELEITKEESIGVHKLRNFLSLDEIEEKYTRAVRDRYTSAYPYMARDGNRLYVHAEPGKRAYLREGGIYQKVPTEEAIDLMKVCGQRLTDIVKDEMKKIVPFKKIHTIKI